MGARAHVMIANPNGITVDGANFVNVGGVVLSTGQSSNITRTTGPGLTQQNIILNTSQGSIDVSGQGLSGAMNSLQLLGKTVKIDGKIDNTSPNLRSQTKIIAGGSAIEYDSAVAPDSDLENWGTVTDTGIARSETAIEITSRGSLKSNTVRIIATDKGAGVSHAGTGLASAGEFTINSKGLIATTGSIKAATNVKLKAREISVKSVATSPQSSIVAVDGSVNIIAETGNISNTGVLISGNKRDITDPDSKGGVVLKAAGDIHLLTEKPDQLAIVFSASDDLIASANHDIVNNTGRFLSNATTRITANGVLTNKIDVIPGETPIGEWQTSETSGKRLWYTVWQDRTQHTTQSVDYGTNRIVGQEAFIVGNNVEIVTGGAVINSGGSINANGSTDPNAQILGSVKINANTIQNSSVATGSLAFEKSCAITCVGYGNSNVSFVGGKINATGAIDLNAVSSISNLGQVTALGNLSMTAPTVTTSGVRTPAVYTRPTGLYNFWQGSYAWIAQQDQGGIFTAPFGKISIDAIHPVIINAGVIEARDGVSAPNGMTIVSPPAQISPLKDHPIGIYHELVGE
jgi:hypothetical protein